LFQCILVEIPVAYISAKSRTGAQLIKHALTLSRRCDVGFAVIDAGASMSVWVGKSMNCWISVDINSGTNQRVIKEERNCISKSDKLERMPAIDSDCLVGAILGVGRSDTVLNIGGSVSTRPLYRLH